MVFDENVEGHALRALFEKQKQNNKLIAIKEEYIESDVEEELIEDEEHSDY